jgi:hypothetical protein
MLTKHQNKRSVSDITPKLSKEALQFLPTVQTPPSRL